MAEGLNILRDDHKKLLERVHQNEQKLYSPKKYEIQAQLMELGDRVRFLECRAEDAEGRSRRSNLHIMDLPEGEKGPDPLIFLNN